MDLKGQQRRAPALAVAPTAEHLLERYYDRFVEWATILTRGDESKAHDLVHDFCLYIAVSQPDLSRVANLDGYLYKSLRNTYLSGLERASREALQFLTVADFDSLQLAVEPLRLSDSLDRQNDLRQICAYSVWRKEHTKSASYFILRFFHGYQQQEIAELSCSPNAVLYPKLRRFRAEVRSYLEEPGRLQVMAYGPLPRLAPRRRLVSSPDLFAELQRIIFDARTGACLSEEELISIYRTPAPEPISCSLLSHIVSCERCLEMIDRHFDRPTLNGRDPFAPKEGLSSDAGGRRSGKPNGNAYKQLLRSVERFRNKVLEHRPQMVSIAVDGKIVASHSVQAQKNILSARIERPQHTNFIEAFSEQDVRLAQLPIDAMPPEGPHLWEQHIELSDGRWLELNLLFDGLGLSSEVIYFDPSLGSEATNDDEQSAFVRILPRVESMRSSRSERPFLSRPRFARWIGAAQRTLYAVMPTSVLAWSVIIAAAFGVGGYLTLHNVKTAPVLNTREALRQSVRAEMVGHEGQTEHVLLHFVEVSSMSNTFEQGTIDFWKDGDGKRYMRRLYDAHHHLLAAEWKQANGRHGEYPMKKKSTQSTAGSELLADGFWKQDISSSASRLLNENNVRIRSTGDGYELFVPGPEASEPRLVSATLILDTHFHPIRETIRVRSGNTIHEARLIEANYERRPTASVPDKIFDPRDQGLEPRGDGPALSLKKSGIDAQLTELYIDVLYQLSSLNADTSEPIEVERTANGRVRVSGVVADDKRKHELIARLETLDQHELLDLRLLSPSDAQKPAHARSRPLETSVDAYNVEGSKAAADSILRAYFTTRGMTGPTLDTAVHEFSHDVLARAQSALQHASALNRLGSTISASELKNASVVPQQQWTEMVERHATALEADLQALQGQILELYPAGMVAPNEIRQEARIESPEQFSQKADQLLIETRRLNRTVGSLFTLGVSPEAVPPDVDLLVANLSKETPLQDAVDLKNFAVKLNTFGKAMSLNRPQSRYNTRLSYR